MALRSATAGERYIDGSRASGAIVGGRAGRFRAGVDGVLDVDAGRQSLVDDVADVTSAFRRLAAGLGRGSGCRVFGLWRGHRTLRGRLIQYVGTPSLRA